MTLVVVQRGHVPRKTGATGAPGEQQFAIDTAAKLAPMLRELGCSVRVIDADVSLAQYRGDLFVAIHYDSGSSSASGASVGYQTLEGRRFAEAWKRAYVDAGWSRGFRQDNYTANLGQYYGVRNAVGQGNRAAIITESGFHSNAGDKALISPTRTARSIAAAVAEITHRGDWFAMATKADLKEAVREVLQERGLVPNKLNQDADMSVVATLSNIHEDANMLRREHKEEQTP